jgi:histidinol-phosphate aminotransferase
MVHPDDVQVLVGGAAPGWTMVLDEAYAEFAAVDHQALATRSPQVVRLRTLSKAFGLAGVRLGYALAHPEVARELRKVVLPFSVSSVQLAVAHALLDAPTLLGERIQMIRSERDRLAVSLRARAVKVRPSVANFLLVQVDDAPERALRLRQAGILVRRQDHLVGLSGALRISVGTPAENDALLQAWDSIAPLEGER